LVYLFIVYGVQVPVQEGAGVGVPVEEGAGVQVQQGAGGGDLAEWRESYLKPDIARALVGNF